MASSDQTPTPTTAAGGVSRGPTPPGRPTTVEAHVLDKGAQMLQSLKPVRSMKQHACSFALYGHDLTRQIETHHYATRLNQDFLQCAVYDSDHSTAHLIGVEYIISDRLFEGLPAEEQKLWHSHAYEIKAGLWVSPRVPEMIQKPELQALTKTYGKFWCTWQADRGDRLPMGAPALMMSPQGVNAGMVHPSLLRSRDDKYGISSEELKESRLELEEPDQWINPNADYWKQHNKGFAVDVVMEAGAHCSSHFGYEASTPYMPHLSILYGDLTEDEKEKARKRVEELDEGLVGLTFEASSIGLFKTDTEDKTLKSWEMIEISELK